MKKLGLPKVVEVAVLPARALRVVGEIDATRTWVHETAAGPVVVLADSLLEAVALVTKEAA